MKNSIYCLLIFLASCASFNQGEKDLEKDLIEQESNRDQQGNYVFNNSKLTKESLKSFEPVAIEKFNELFEQLKIATHPSYDDNFKQEAVKAVVTALVSKTAPNIEKTITDRNLWTYLTEYTEHNLHEEELEKVYFGEPLELAREDVYAGTISFKLSESNHIKTINTYLIKVVKTFGTEQEEVWEVRFDLFRW